MQDSRAQHLPSSCLHVALVAITKLEGFHAADFMAFQEVMLALVATGLLLGAMVTERRETEEHLREQRAALSRMSRYADGGGNGRFIGPPNKSAIVNHRNLLARRAPSIDDFFKQMEDHWTFCSALADIYAVKEMGDQRRDDEVAATLPSSTEEDWDDDDNEAIETGDLLARLVANELLSDEDTERELEEPADRSDV